MSRFKSVFYCGHESRYGLAHLEPLLRSKLFGVERIVIASYGRWLEFRRLLSGQALAASWTSQLRFALRLWRFKSQVHKICPGCAIAIRDDANHSSETAAVQQYNL